MKKQKCIRFKGDYYQKISKSYYEKNKKKFKLSEVISPTLPNQVLQSYQVEFPFGYIDNNYYTMYSKAIKNHRLVLFEKMGDDYLCSQIYKASTLSKFFLDVDDHMPFDQVIKSLRSYRNCTLTEFTRMYENYKRIESICKNDIYDIQPIPNIDTDSIVERTISSIMNHRAISEDAMIFDRNIRNGSFDIPKDRNIMNKIYWCRLGELILFAKSYKEFDPLILFDSSGMISNYHPWEFYFLHEIDEIYGSLHFGKRCYIYIGFYND